MLYHFVKYLLKLYLPLFFRRIKIEGKQQIPSDGAIIFAVNHQNTFLDAVLPLYQYKKAGYFMMRSDLFKGKILNAFFRALHLLPIYRSQDGAGDIRSKNMTAFRKNGTLLQQGHPLLIFPEGTSKPEFVLKPLKKGTARMAINLVENEFRDKKLHVVPVAIQYENLHKSGGRLWIKYLSPILVNDLPKKNNSPAILYKQLTHEVRTALARALLTDSKEKSVEAFFASTTLGAHMSLEDLKCKYEQWKPSPHLTAKKTDWIRFLLKLVFFPTYLLSKLINRAVNDKVYQLSILCYSGMILGLLQSLLYLYVLFEII